MRLILVCKDCGTKDKNVSHNYCRQCGSIKLATTKDSK